MDSDDQATSQKLSTTPLSNFGRLAFVALSLAAILATVVSDSVPVGVAVLAVGGLILGAVLLMSARRPSKRP